MLPGAPFTEENTTTTGTGNLTLSGAIDSRHQTINAAIGTNGVTGYYLLDGNGTDWECGVGTSTGVSGFSRDAIWKSTNSNAKISLSANVHKLRLAPIPGIDFVGDPGGLLSLHPTDPYYDPQNTVAVSGQNTTTDELTVTAHGWASGTVVSSSATSGGLTAATKYFVRAVDANTITLHTGILGTMNNSARIDITGTVTASLTAFGMVQTSIYYIPAKHNCIQLWNGAFWQRLEFSITELALGTITATIGYDIFAYINNGTLALEKLAWSSGTARETEIEMQDGRWVKVGDKTRLYIGSFYSNTINSAQDYYGGVISQDGGKRLLFNNTYVKKEAKLITTTNSWSNTSTTIRQAEGAAGNKIELFTGLETDISGELIASVYQVNSSAQARVGIGLDTTTAFSGFVPSQYVSAGSGAFSGSMKAVFSKKLFGYHYLSWNEQGSGATCTFIGDDGAETQSGMKVTVG